MSISSSMYTSMSSLFCLGKKMEALGDNIANVNTNGFRTSKVGFEDVLLKAANTGGVKINPMGFTSDFSREGTAESSHIATNMAISGDGLFILRDKDDSSATYYTRAGEFSFDAGGYLVNPGGHMVQGYEFDNQGIEGTSLTDIQLELTTPAATVDNPDPVPRLVSSPSPSTRLTITCNVDARSQDHSPGGLFAKWDATNAEPISLNDYELRAEHYIYDSSGDRHSIEIYYDKTPQDNIWEYLITAPPDGTGAASDDGVLARGNITFDGYGRISDMSIENYQGGAWTAGTANSNGYLAFQTSFSGAGTIEFDAGATYVNGLWQHDPQTTTQFGYGSYAKSSSSDGNGEGELMYFSVGRDGVISATFNNSVISDLFRVALAKSTDPSSRLNRIGSTLYQADQDTDLIVDGPGSSGLGTILGNSLETSNVELVEQFGDLIFTQRAIQANAKGIVAADEMVKTAMDLKR
jgi:flagellar hook protein FlgE